MAARGGLMNTFLPAGYPGSVRPEYARYRCWDIVQVGVWRERTSGRVLGVVSIRVWGRPRAQSLRGQSLFLSASVYLFLPSFLSIYQSVCLCLSTFPSPSVPRSMFSLSLSLPLSGYICYELPG